MKNLKENYLCVQVFENGKRKIIGFYETYEKAFKMLDFNDYKIEILKVTTIKRNFKITPEFTYKESQKDSRSERPF
ncbi:hypothetical protein [Mycoplasmopsis cynos]|uniref:Uncharacterized protein n=1 Tax=Mycoplasmopsis cynos (strain C142) TaxID=1246955 RepID=L0RW13_MYCC1|nr:hypothetical protein [Mycoplasmopsis cynos]WQQ12927.1 hypothetical protein RRG58_03050 [Mycoplasmopsis cynos]WQQ13292.1 hypothetical protein RRG58_00885 [Mycoplasmopsis cynos]WQQ13567.1 hypothetical protein RRG52_02290 [Mycoplasmopsis cynos]WQQ13817.1 hypothetical protein RRG52_03635 [Mycoplasmopsis cynos]WQQ14575.1 hypothetical protein RRG42_03125 [Mycoplasmopsis cynos]